MKMLYNCVSVPSSFLRFREGNATTRLLRVALFNAFELIFLIVYYYYYLPIVLLHYKDTNLIWNYQIKKQILFATP